MKKICLLVLLLAPVVSFAQEELYIVDSPDIAQEGWYWEPTGGGWGLNMTIQPSTQSPTGFYLQGASYTYDEDGKPTWFTFQNPYTPNEDVYAWREGRGPMGTFESLLAVSTNGGCLDCPTVPADVAASDKGTIRLEWSDPLNMTMTVNGTTKVLKHFFFHDGLNNPSTDFITQYPWFVHGVTYLSLFDTYIFIKGMAHFVTLSDDIRDKILLETPSFVFDDTLDWYVTEEHNITRFESTDNIFLNPSVRTDLNVVYILMSYDKNTGSSNLYTGSFENLASTDHWYLSYCNDVASTSYNGILRPQVAQSSRFYFNNDTSDTNCTSHGLDVNVKRQVFLDLTMLPTSSGLLTVPAMYQ